MKPKEMIITMSVCLALTLCSVLRASAEEKTRMVDDGFYLGVMMVQNSMSGDFDNTTVYYTSTTLYDVPDVDNGSGFGIAAGYRMDRGVYEMAYQRTSHDTNSSFTDVGDSASYSVLDFNFKYDVAKLEKIRPYVLLGFGISWMTVEDSSTDGYDLEDETFLGHCWNLGAGMSYFFNPKLAVTGGIVSRWNTFKSVEGVELGSKLKEKAVGLSIGMTYTF